MKNTYIKLSMWLVSVWMNNRVFMLQVVDYVYQEVAYYLSLDVTDLSSIDCSPEQTGHWSSAQDEQHTFVSFKLSGQLKPTLPGQSDRQTVSQTLRSGETYFTS